MYQFKNPPYYKFLPYVGNNHEKLPPPNTKRGGGVSFIRHIGKPLTAALWEDLVDRCHVTGMDIIAYSHTQWMLGRGDGWVSIYLNEDETVRDIYLHPHAVPGWWKKWHEAWVKGGCMVHEEPGVAMIDNRRIILGEL